MQVKANGININYQIDGPEGAPWLVFSNSLMTNLTMWDDQAAALSKSLRVLRYDQRGHGGTETTEPPYSFDTLIADVVGLLDALSIKRTHFAGISMGGVTTLLMAQKHPDRVEKVIACDCGPGSSPASAQQWQERIDLVLKEGGMAALVEPTVGRWFPPEFMVTKNPVLDKVRGQIRTTPVKGFIGCAKALSDYDVKPGLGSIKHPVLLICGTKDATYPGTKALNAAIKGSKLVPLEGAGHLSNLEEPDAFTKAVREFLTAG